MMDSARVPCTTTMRSEDAVGRAVQDTPDQRPPPMPDARRHVAGSAEGEPERLEARPSLGSRDRGAAEVCRSGEGAASKP